MTKIKKYPIKNPVSSDKFVGSDSENSDKTVNFSFDGVLSLLNSLNESEAISYVFSTESSGELDENGIGYFISENDIINPGDLTKIIVSKSIVSGIDLSELFMYMGVNKANFVLKLRNVSDPNNFIYLNIVSVTEEEFSFSFSVSVNGTGGFLGELVDTKMYSFLFETVSSTDTDVIHKTLDETKIGTLTVNKTQTSGGVALVGQSTTKANGEQFYAQSGESILGVSAPVIESQSGGIGTDFTPSNTVVALKFNTTASASFIQGIRLRIKKTGALTDLSTVVVRMYTDNLGVPGTAFGGGGTIFANNISSTYTDVDAIIQNVTIPISTSTPYWVVITRTESGGSFVFDSSIGTGTTYQGATTETANVDTGRQIFNTIYARSAYGGHFVAEHSHGAWGTSITGAGIRGDSKSHFGGFFKSRDDWGSQSESTNSGGSIGISVNGVGSAARTSSTNVNTPAFRAEHTSGITGLGSIVSGRSYLLGRTVIGAGVDYNATLEVVGGISRFSGKVLLNATGVDVSTQDKGFTLDVNGSILKRAFGVTTPYTSVGNGELSIGGRAGGTVPAITTRTNSTTLTGMLITAIQNANTTRTGDADIILKTGFENGSDAIQTLTTAGAALQVLNNTTPLLNVYRNGNVSIGSPPDAGYKLDVDGTAIIRSILTLSATPTTSVGTYEIVTRNSATGVVEKITSSTLPNLGVKTYTALINQTGTSAPTVTVLGSNTVGTIVWTRSTSGFYFGTLSGAFPAGKTFFTITPSSSSASYAMFRNTDNQIVIRTQDNSTVPFTDSDDKLFSNSIRIEVYP